MLASGGYPWTVIRVEDRSAYLEALDRASIDVKIEPFTESSRIVCGGRRGLLSNLTEKLSLTGVLQVHIR